MDGGTVTTRHVPSQTNSGRNIGIPGITSLQARSRDRNGIPGWVRITKALAIAGAGVVPVGKFITVALAHLFCRVKRTKSIVIYCGPGWHYPDYTVQLTMGEPIGLSFSFVKLHRPSL